MGALAHHGSIQPAEMGENNQNLVSQVKWALIVNRLGKGP